MRFDDLLADLEAHLAAGSDREMWDEAQALMRGERARQDWAVRLATAPLWTLGLAGGHSLRGEVLRSGEGWVLVRHERAEALIRLESLRTARPEAPSTPGQRGEHGHHGHSSFRAAVRQLSRHRPHVQAWLDSGERHRGRLIQVGRDHLELRAEGPGDLLLGLNGLAALLVHHEN